MHYVVASVIGSKALLIPPLPPMISALGALQVGRNYSMQSWLRRVSVVIGNYDGELDIPPVEVPAEEILVHPEYGPDRGKPKLHNIALIRLAREVTLNALVQPINLPALPVKSTNDSSVISVRLRTVGQSKTSDNSSDSRK